MRLSPGSRLGPYTIVSGLAAGGMGEVYHARDTRLNRDVAVKVLPRSVNDDAALRARFEREAQALAALNHPHIAAIYDVLDVGDHRAIVMELVTGSTLADRIEGGALPVRAAIEFGIDIADALSAAHATGIVHRDLKPANIAITEGSSAKVLDFGIAKREVIDSAAAADRPTTAALTGDLALIGTVGYMSPEQAHGRPVDARSDIFSLGVVLYEAISGRRAFHGETTAAVLSALLRDDPTPLRALVPSIPRAVERCVMRCLDKDPRRRYQSAADLKIVLEDVRDDLSAPAGHSANAPTTPTLSSSAGRAPRWFAFVAATIAVGAVGFMTARSMNPSVVLTPVYRPFITEVTSAGGPAWSPDGRTLAYYDVVDGRQQIFTRGIDSAQSTQLTKDPSSGSPAWSSDGSRIYFVRARDGNLVSVSAGGGEPQIVPSGEKAGDERIGRFCISPDGRTIVFMRGALGDTQLVALDIHTGKTRPLEPAGMPRPLANIQALAFSRDGTTLAIQANATALNQSRGIWLMSWPDGATRHLLANAPFLASGFTISWTRDSRRIVMSGTPLQGGASRLLVVDADTGSFSTLTGGKDSEESPSVSPDGARIAFVTQKAGMDLIQFPVKGGAPVPLLATSRSETVPDLSASDMLAYITDASGYAAVRLRSVNERWSRELVGGGDLAAFPGEVRLSPDGSRAAVGLYAAEHLTWIYPTAGGTPVRLDPESTDHHGPSWSPDGNWVAYRRLFNGSWSLVKRPLGGGAVVRLDDADPGGAPTDWSSTGRWIAHSRPDGMHFVSPDGGPPRVLPGLRTENFRFSRDGASLYVVRRGAERRWELTIWDVESGRERQVVALPLTSSTQLQGMTLSPDESHIIVSAGVNTSDIWLLEQFEHR